MRAALVGLGQVSACGAGAAALRAALESGHVPEPEPLPCPGPSGPASVPVLKASLRGAEALLDPRATRRMDPFSRGALAAAALALADAGPSSLEAERTGVLVATGHGAVSASFAFLRDVIEKGDRRGSPITFASSVHSAPASAITSGLDLRGPVLTVTGRSDPVVEALWLALDWLAEGDADQVLLVTADEVHEVLGYRRLLDAGAEAVLPGEAYAALLLARPGEARPRWGQLGEPASSQPPEAAATLLDAAGRPGEGPRLAEVAAPAGAVACYAPLWGTTPTGLGMTLAAAATCLAAGRLFPPPADASSAPGSPLAPHRALDPAATLACWSAGGPRPICIPVAGPGTR